jgi:hypothetical protein
LGHWSLGSPGRLFAAWCQSRQSFPGFTLSLLGKSNTQPALGESLVLFEARPAEVYASRLLSKYHHSFWAVLFSIGTNVNHNGRPW